MTGKLLRTIRLDPSDTFAFERAAEPGEWAVPGSFMFIGVDLQALRGKPKVAFRSGWLGIGSFGWSTLAVVVRATAEERAAAVNALAAHLIADHGAPDEATARLAAEEEISYAESCADLPEQTIVIVHRSIGDDGDMREQVRTIKPGLPFDPMRPAPVFTFVEDADADEPDEHVDLLALETRDRSGREAF